MSLHVHVNDSPHVHPLMMQHDVITILQDFKRRTRRTPDAAYRNRIAPKHRVVLKWIVTRDGLLTRRCQKLNHGLRTAGATIRIRREQPRAEDVLAVRNSNRLWRTARTRRTVH